MKAKIILALLGLVLIGIAGEVIETEEPSEATRMTAVIDSIITEGSVVTIYCHNTINDILRFHMAHATYIGGMSEPVKTRFIYNTTVDTNDVIHTDEIDSTSNWTRFTATDSARGLDTCKKCHLIDDYDSLLTTALPNAAIADGQQLTIKWKITLE